MELKVKNYFDNESLEHIGTRYFADNEEISFEDYSGLINDLFGNNGENTESEEYNNQSENDCVCSLDGNCEKCDCSECDGCGNIECCNGNIECMDCEDEELGNECECPICTGKEEAMKLCCYCEECLENYMKESIEECLEVVFEDSCSECKIDGVLKLAYKCLELGKQGIKQDVMEYLEK